MLTAKTAREQRGFVSESKRSFLNKERIDLTESVDCAYILEQVTSAPTRGGYD